MAASKKSQNSNTKKLIVVIAIVLILLFIIIIAAKLSSDKNNNGNDVSESAGTSCEAPAPTDINPLTGMSGFDAQGKRPVAVMINNSKPARPQWGLCTPDIVVEGVTEAGITRMLWLYADIDDVPDKLKSQVKDVLNDLDCGELAQ